MSGSKYLKINTTLFIYKHLRKMYSVTQSEKVNNLIFSFSSSNQAVECCYFLDLSFCFVSFSFLILK